MTKTTHLLWTTDLYSSGFRKHRIFFDETTEDGKGCFVVQVTRICIDQTYKVFFIVVSYT